MIKFKRNSPEYSAVHHWIKKEYGKAYRCDNACDNKTKRYEWANLSGEYLRELSDWKMLCVPCHRAMDLYKPVCANGHLMTGDNLYIRPNTKQRGCLACKRLWWRNARGSIKIKALGGERRPKSLFNEREK